MKLENEINKNAVPQHIAIIMDGNGRWAKQREKTRIFGHQEGASSVDAIVTAAAELQIKFLTLYAFSTENWNRPPTEVSGLMELLVDALQKYTKKLVANNVRLLTIGDIKSLPQKTQKKLHATLEKTKHNTGLTLVLALSYSSRWEITEAVKKLAHDCCNKAISTDSITQETISEYLCTHAIPDPDLLIRTSGEYRISNFLLWQIAYTELYFSDVLWPDFKKEHLLEAIKDYQKRERRFGKTGEQIK